VAHVYVDRESGTHGRRPELRRMMADAQARKFDVLIFWAMDRFGREGGLTTLLRLKQLTDIGIGWMSYTEPMLRTTDATGELLVALVACFARMEAERIRERVNAGLARARAQG